MNLNPYMGRTYGSVTTVTNASLRASSTIDAMTPSDALELADEAAALTATAQLRSRARRSTPAWVLDAADALEAAGLKLRAARLRAQ
jgi:hypothetical protein